jgi:hypothetical protein
VSILFHALFFNCIATSSGKQTEANFPLSMK